jgi:hypothetical protein
VSTDVHIRDSLFDLNNGTDGAGALSIIGRLSIDESQFTHKSGEYYKNGSAGAIDLTGSGQISSSLFAYNSTHYSGGAIQFGGNYLLVADSTIANNDAHSGYGGSGGGIEALSGNLVIRNSTLTNNFAGGILSRLIHPGRLKRLAGVA